MDVGADPHSICGSPHHCHPDSHHLRHTSTPSLCSGNYCTEIHQFYIAVALVRCWRRLEREVGETFNSSREIIYAQRT